MELSLYAITILYFLYDVYMESTKQLHMAQLEGYKPIQYWWWIKENSKILILGSIAPVIFLAAVTIWSVTSQYTVGMAYTAVIGWIVLSSLMIMKRGKVEAKKPLVFTPRATRLFATHCILALIFLSLSLLLSKDIVIFILLLSIIRCLVWLVMLIATRINFPIEMSIQMGFKKEAMNKIQGMKDLKVVGITGSYGKTSTKYFVNTILAEKYNTIMTPSSFNTPMGITKVIREELTKEHEVFVCEMGARNVGDIKELCEIAHPHIGIISSIGPQHLATFKSIENICSTKYELIDALPQDGVAIFNGDNKYCKEMWDKTKLKKYIYSINDADYADLKAENIKVSKKGLIFTIKDGNGLEFECKTKLLGKVNISNILAAVRVALELGLTAEQIKRGIKKIEPVPHRLEILNTNNGITVIDDAFNSNPEGAKEAVETIRDLTDGNRIVITPGMVELGEIEYEENKKFGKTMASCCDYAILIGLKRTKAIVEGLREGNFPEDRIIVVPTLNEGTTKLGQIVKVGDVVLFENDLPDNYNEN